MGLVNANSDLEKVRRYYWLFVMVQVLALTVLVGFPFGPLQRRYEEGSEVALARIRGDVEGGLKVALGMFEVDCNRYPTTEEGLSALISRPENISVQDWRGPDFDSPEVPKDPWDNEYVYRFPGIHNTAGYDLYSCGVDGVSMSSGGDLDDINNWDVDSPRGGALRERSSDGIWLLRAWRALLVIPICFIIRIVVAIRSPRFRAVVAGTRFADVVWLLMSAAVVFLNLLFLTT
jgi:general secretion pathway protein G